MLILLFYNCLIAGFIIIIIKCNYNYFYYFVIIAWRSVQGWVTVILIVSITVTHL